MKTVFTLDVPDRYYAFFRDQMHPALRWDRVDFEEGCVYFEATKFGAGKAPLMGEMESALRAQKVLRDASYPEFPYVNFWFDYRLDKNGEQIRRFDAFLAAGSTGPGEEDAGRRR
jgi:hypothetical protein